MNKYDTILDIYNNCARLHKQLRDAGFSTLHGDGPERYDIYRVMNAALLWLTVYDMLDNCVGSIEDIEESLHDIERYLRIKNGC